MRQRVNLPWIREMKERLDEHTEDVPFRPQIISYNPAAKWLIAAMANRGLVASVENLGAGVKRIGIKGICCPVCGAIK